MTHTPSIDVSAIRDRILVACYSPTEAAYGIHYAIEQGAKDEQEGFILAMSRILYSDEQLADGARWAVEA